jgi:phosphoribosylformylglycinamidine (FGAM) synthase-like enzyme
LDAARAVLARWDLDAHVIGHTTDTGRFVIQHAGAQVVDIPLAPICSGAPKPEPVHPIEAPPDFTHWRALPETDWSWNDVLLTALASPHFASKSWIYRQYDHQVQTNTVVAPGAGAAVIRARGADLFIAATSDGNGIWCALDPYEGTKCVTAEAARNLAASGARPVAVTNNLNFGNPRTGAVAWQIAESIRGLGDACRAFDTPVTGGNVSLYNESTRMAVFPTPVVGMVGIIRDAKHITRAHFSAVDEAIVLLGPAATHAGGSRILRDISGELIGPAIYCDLDLESISMNCILELIQSGFVTGAADISDGGLLMTLSEMALSNHSNVGFRVRVPEGMNDVAFLLSEEPSRYVFTCTGEHLTEVIAHCSHAGVEARVIGRTADNVADIAHKVSLPLDRLRRAWMTES